MISPHIIIRERRALMGRGIEYFYILILQNISTRGLPTIEKTPETEEVEKQISEEIESIDTILDKNANCDPFEKEEIYYKVLCQLIKKLYSVNSKDLIKKKF